MFTYLVLPDDPVLGLHLIHQVAGQPRTAFRRRAQVTTADWQNLHRLIQDGGFSYHPTKGYPSGGYVWSHRADQYHPSTSHQWGIDDLRPEHLSTHRELLTRNGHLDEPHKYQGAWLDHESGQVYLDKSHVSPDHAETRQAALANKQMAYYDLNKNRDIYFDKHQDAAFRRGDAEAKQKYKEVEDEFGPGVPSEYHSYRHLYE